MKFNTLVLQNFQSYEHLSFDYSDLGLTLISGDTGAGKSTLVDGLSWTLFGVTSKDTNADDVRSWNADGPTSGVLHVSSEKYDITITRIRGKSNDLFYTNSDSPDTKIRGKDLPDTQKILEAVLGVGPELFLLGSYLQQFSKVDTFFIAKAKERRDVLENIVDLSFPVKLLDRCNAHIKTLKQDINVANLKISRLNGELSQSMEAVNLESTHLKKWKIAHLSKVKEYEAKSSTFSDDVNRRIHTITSKLEELQKVILDDMQFTNIERQIKEQLTAITNLKKEAEVLKRESYLLSSKLKLLTEQVEKLNKNTDPTCPACLGPADNENRRAHLANLDLEISIESADLEAVNADLAILTEACSIEASLKDSYDRNRTDRENNKRLIAERDTLKKEVIGLRSASNVYMDELASLKLLVNPHVDTLELATSKVRELEKSLQDYAAEVLQLEESMERTKWLGEKSFELRGVLLHNAIEEIADKVNSHLDKYFDASIRIKLTIDGGDKVEVDITNNGNSCNFKQLSGGERRVLAFTFSMVLMEAVQNKAGVSFSLVALDESLNGMDDSLKMKAFKMLEALSSSYGTILVIDHCEEFKNLFSSKFTVTHDGTSKIRQTA